MIHYLTVNETSEKQVEPQKPAGPDYTGITVNKVIAYDKEKPAKGKVKGDEVKEGSTVTCNYGMWIYDPKALGNRGAEISSGKDFTFQVGKGEVIKGFEQGVVGMHVGGSRTLVIPAELAYGDAGNDKVPPKMIVQVEVQVTKIGK